MGHHRAATAWPTHTVPDGARSARPAGDDIMPMGGAASGAVTGDRSRGGAVFLGTLVGGNPAAAMDGMSWFP